MKISILTATRAEYGLLRCLISRISKSAKIELQLIISGTHLKHKFGFTLEEIKNDSIDESTIYLLPFLEDCNCSIAENMAKITCDMEKLLRRIEPDLFIVLGDRYETFAAATSSYLLNIPILHIHGGETTLGSLDEGFRHSITHMSKYHFTSHYHHYNRVAQLKNSEENIFNVGPMVLDSVINPSACSFKEFTNKTSYGFKDYNLLVTYHPVTTMADNGVSELKMFLKAITYSKCNALFTAPNADEGSLELSELIENFVNSNTNKYHFVPSLGHLNYIKGLRLFDAVAGNSSSGIIEAPLVGIPVVNIGKRQLGRTIYGAITTCDNNYLSMCEAISKSLEVGASQAKPRNISQKQNSPSEYIYNWITDNLSN